jgi:hypothetical protein
MHREAAIEMVSVATIERIQMSTKTTIKRVALVAVAAMGFGLLSVVPSSATSQADTLSISATGNATTVAVNTAATTTLTQTFLGIQSDTMTVTASTVSYPAGGATSVTLSGTTASLVNAGFQSISALTATFSDTASGTTYTEAKQVLTVTMPATSVAGTYTFKFTASNNPTTLAVTAAPVVWTVTVTAAAAVTAALTQAWIAGGATTPTSALDTAGVSTSTTTAGTQIANVAVLPGNTTLGVGVTGTILSANIVSGPGNLSFGATPTGRSITGTANQWTVNLFADGTSGVTTFTISAGSVLLATKTVTTYGAVASIVTTLVNGVIPVGSAGAAVGAITAVAKDANGTIIPSPVLYAVSSDATIISNAYSASTTSTGGVATFGLTGVLAGTANITITNGNTSVLSTVVSNAVAVRVGAGTAATVAVTFDKAAYALGEKATVTVTVKDAAGNLVPNGTYSVFTAAGLVSNFGLDSTGTTALANAGAVGVVAAGSTGTATYTVFMPSYASDVTLTATGNASAAATIAGLTITSSTVSVANAAADAATDAANAATDAANYAADAADAATTAAEEATAAAQDAADAAKAAQDSADAATAAVVDLGLKVTGLIASLRSQLTALTNLIVKIQAQIAKLPKK